MNFAPAKGPEPCDSEVATFSGPGKKPEAVIGPLYGAAV